MKSAKDILRQKEAELARVRHEVESLKIVVGLLADGDPTVKNLNQTSEEPGENRVANAEKALDAPAEATGTHGLFASLADQRPKRWNVLKRHS
ncbi:MAG TPA: hypothetical protein VJO35_06210 [Terriglobales bacterium]|nr:hypothetical protein [Terriglobales bacterium]